MFYFILLALLSSLIKISFNQIIESDRGLQDRLSWNTFYVTLIKFPFFTFSAFTFISPFFFYITLIRDITKLYTCRKISRISHLPHPFSRLREDKTGKGGGGCSNTGISYCSIKVPRSPKERKIKYKELYRKGISFCVHLTFPWWFAHSLYCILFKHKIPPNTHSRIVWRYTVTDENKRKDQGTLLERDLVQVP